jgi:N-succinyldiaminopimelate aminotransferase
MNPRLGLLQPYPFEKLRALLSGATPPKGLGPITMQIGEPQHPTPSLVKDALTANLATLARYPLTKGLPELRQSIATWLAKRHELGMVDAEREVLPVTGTREALFAIAQAVLDPSEADALVICPNPFYQIYEGAALLAGAKPWFLNALPGERFRPAWDAIPEDVWRRTRLLYTCSPNNPNGRVMTREEWRQSSGWPTAMASSSSPTSATARSTSTKRPRRWGPCAWRASWDARTSPTWW